jgi:hypothetical protein
MESKASNYEPLADALQELIEPEGWWVGSEQELFMELRTPAGEEASTSEGIPTSLEELEEHMWLASEIFAEAALHIDDYRRLSWAHIEGFDVPGWSEETPILVYRWDCAFLHDYHDDLSKVLEHWDPFPLALFLFAVDEELGNGRSWEGTTSELAAAMCRHHGDRTRVPEWLSEMYRPSWATDTLPEFKDDDEYASLMQPETPEDYEAFAERMRASKPFLESNQIGVHLEEGDSGGRTSENADVGHTDWERARWVVKAPRWVMSEYL